MYSGYKVVINEPKAYMHHNVHVINYQRYKGNNGKQVIIRNSTDPKYVVVNAKYKKENEQKEKAKPKKPSENKNKKDRRL
jgi:hypothetical protein